MPAAVQQKPLRRNRDSAPPTKKAKLAQSAPPATPTRQNGLKALINGTATQKPTAQINGVKNARQDRVDEATAIVDGGQAGHGDVDMEDAEKEVIEISSAEEDSDEFSDEEQKEEDAAAGAQEIAAPAVIHAEEEERLDEDETADPEELSFGDRLHAQDSELTREPRIVDVESAFVGQNPESKSLATTTQSRPLSVPSSSSLGTVLTQALRTNDQELFETCLRVVDVDSIYATVERLPSPLVGLLLQKLAEKLHRKPGRAGMLMIWVQWSLAAHGGYLASQPQLVKQMATLNKVLKERASGLQPLLGLKGRLDMLSAQLELRRRNQKRAANDDEDEAVIYVEGEDEYVSSADGSVDGDAAPILHKRIRADLDEDDESSIDEMPTTMEVDEESEEGSQDSEGLIDDEAEETEGDTGDNMSEPMSDDLEDGEGVSDSEAELKPARRSTAARTGFKSRG